MPAGKSISVGLAWYTAADYAAARLGMVDGNSLPNTHAQWERAQMGVERTIMENGVKAYRVYLRPEAFFPWCARERRAADKDARIAYASLAARENAHAGVEPQSMPDEPTEI